MVGKDKKRVFVSVDKELLSKYYLVQGEKLSLSEIFRISLEEYIKGLQ